MPTRHATANARPRSRNTSSVIFHSPSPAHSARASPGSGVSATSPRSRRRPRPAPGPPPRRTRRPRARGSCGRSSARRALLEAPDLGERDEPRPSGPSPRSRASSSGPLRSAGAARGGGERLPLARLVHRRGLVALQGEPQRAATSAVATPWQRGLLVVEHEVGPRRRGSSTVASTSTTGSWRRAGAPRLRPASTRSSQDVGDRATSATTVAITGGPGGDSTTLMRAPCRPAIGSSSAPQAQREVVALLLALVAWAARLTRRSARCGPGRR